MKILEYEFSTDNWNIHKVNFQQFNLIVGDSGTGKTRLLNTIFNLGSYVAKSKLVVRNRNEWKLSLGIGDDKYYWNIITEEEENDPIVKSEILYLNEKLILKRERNEIIIGDITLPKLPRDVMSISVLKEEEILKPLYNGFSKIMRRNFFTDVLEISAGIYPVNERILDKIGSKKDLFELFKSDLGLNPKLYILSNYFPDIYEKIITLFKEAFPFVTDISIVDSSSFDLLNIPGRAPIFCIKESSVDKLIRLDELSSGMQKTLLILTDLLSMPDDSIYLIDEYENSMGIGPLDVLPNLLLSEDIDTQIFVTSHHPYIITKIPVKNWYVAHRKGPDVIFTYGEELEKRYSVSSQEKYIQLINDPIFYEGAE